MTKLIVPGSQRFDAAVASLVKVAADGRFGANDLTAFVKRAGHQFVDYLRKNPFLPGEVPIHLIAIGATEFYGPNRNGDGFTEPTLQKYAHTFVTKPVTREGAYFYRDHQNKNPLKSYGTVKAAFYNPLMHRVELLVALNGTQEAAERNRGLLADRELEKLARDDGDGDAFGVSMACPRLGTLVKLKRGFRKVEDIRPGDEVLTHRGRYKPVYATIRRVKRQFARISTKYYGRQVLEFTPEHRFFVARWEDLPSPQPQRAGKERSWQFKKRHRHALAAHARWLPCGDLRPGDLLLMPIYRGSGKSDLPPEMARAMGYYTAEGSVTSDGYPCFTCNKEDRAVVELRDWAEGISRTHSEHEHSASDKAVNLTVYSKPHGSLMATEVGCGVRNKVVPQAVYDAPADVKLEYLAGWFNGDGWQDAKGLHWSTCSRTLSLELQMLLASIGLPASVYRIDHTSDLPDRPRTGDGIEYTVNVSNRYAGVFVGRSKAEPWGELKEKTTVFITGDYLAVPVRGVELVEEEVEVCDLSVETDESFTAFGLAVHNCRVPFDVCSGCGNRARHRGEYCTARTCKYGGLAEHITKVAADGHVLHADNPDPAFFDISHVYRPADRTAYVMGMLKAAGGVVLGGAELAERAGLAEPAAAAAGPPAVALQVKLARALAAAEERAAAGPAAFEARAFHPTLAAPTGAEAFGKTAGARRAAVRALADRRVLLPVADFLALASGEPVEKLAALAGRVAARLPGVFGRLLADPDAFDANPYLPTDVASAAAKRWAEKCAGHALDARAVTDRATTALLRELPEPRTAAPGAADEPAEKLARQYALYQLGFLGRWADTVEAPRLSDLAVARNYARW